jgi:alanyl-tRNA synthetase
MEIRKIFLEYFKKNGHLIIPSSSLIPQNDPSVLLTTAGMQQFKPYYLDTETPPRTRITTVQKCFRTSDIDNVGYTDRHLTFFEMLGNFSFGDYFKKESIEFAIDFIVNVLKLPKGRLTVAVFEGDSNIPADEESICYWIDGGIEKDKIYKFDKNENFWGPAGNTGPCGPCTEIYYDFGPDAGCGRKECDPCCQCGRFLEIWNLVFTQYNFDGNEYTELPKKNIDTGMGLERIAAVLEGQSSIFKTSLFNPILDRICEITGKNLTDAGDKDHDGEINIALRVLADHSRAIYFLLADGIVPSNEGRGYILRRIIRRAIRFGKKLGIDDYFLNKIGRTVIDNYSQYYPELSEKGETACRIVLDEEKRFTRTLKEGTIILNEMINRAAREKGKQFDPKDAFMLYETYGFPVELTSEILEEHNIKLDPKIFDKYFKEHAEKSRRNTSFDKKVDKKLLLYKRISTETKTDFLGYEKEVLKTTIKGIIKISADGNGVETKELSAGEKGEIILDSTVFYGEKGGQTGDSGIIRSAGGIFIVNDTQIPLEGAYMHKGFIKEGKISHGEEVEIGIDGKKRGDIERNHTSTHLLHWALRNVFGEEVKQSGSYVANTRLRFDYSIYNAPKKKKLLKIEKMINEKIQRDDLVKCFETTMEYARELGTIALFGEKYGKFVRVVEIDDYNRELCGGTHVRRTGEIGIFKIISDTSIGANLRRIEAVTGMHAYELIKEKEEILGIISKGLEVEEKKLAEEIIKLKTDNQDIAEEFSRLRIKMITGEILNNFKKSSGGNKYNIINCDLSGSDISSGVPVNDMGTIADRLKDDFKNKRTFVVIGNISAGKPILILTCTKDMTEAGINCGKLAKEVGSIVKGGGGGRPDFAQLGGSDKGSLTRAIDFAARRAEELVKI